MFKKDVSTSVGNSWETEENHKEHCINFKKSKEELEENLKKMRMKI